ncbi:M15 family metallopeptidase [Pseudoalteromonas xiamenensis]|uniref:M15 family metallopeptidase n=1 Tax=Pseudoalteromonas xiamenensis TaxID=882626 RepID=UPI0027E5421C|nr:M15 family metallopeptidase [Pseudoalteromonas xiamenensis]WMN60184.1 M15 family metallopeptidase [Pseudoalteromonas xiamenensis]
MRIDVLELTGKTQTHVVQYENVLVHPLVIGSLHALKQRAQRAGFDLSIASGFRSFERQMLIWNNKFDGLRSVYSYEGKELDVNVLSVFERISAIMLFSALPGASRHHWGCDFDVYAKNLTSDAYPLQLTPAEYFHGDQAPFYMWLDEELKGSDFYFPYREFRGGVAEEPWHISFHPVATRYAQTMTINHLIEALVNSDVRGKEEIISHLPNLYSKYISNTCKFSL